MAYPHPSIDTTPLDPADADRKLIVDRVLKRVRLSKATRTLQTRLSLASFKAARGWHNVTFDVIEPHMTQAAEQRRRSNTAPVVRNDSPDRLSSSRAPDRRRVRNPAPTTLVTPDRRTNVYPTQPPAQRPLGIPPPTFSEFSHAIPYTDPVRRSTYRQASAMQPSLKRSLPQDVFQTSYQHPHTPSGPEASSSNEYVAAANVLNSLSRAPSAASLLSASPLAWPRSCPPGGQTAHHPTSAQGSRTSHTPERSPLPSRPHHPTKSLTELEEDEAQANAAELMLFLAAGSPSPTRRPGPEPETPSTDPDPITARRLFGVDQPDVTPPALDCRAKGVIGAVALSASSSQTSSRSANSTVSTSAPEPEWRSSSATVGSYCERAMEDLLQLAPTPERVRSAADARSKALGRSLTRTQTQPVVGGDAKVW